MTNKQTEEVIKEFRKKFELHDLGKDEFTLCCNNDDGTCDGGISIFKESQGEAERHLKNVEQFILTAIKEAEERLIEIVEDELSRLAVDYEVVDINWQGKILKKLRTNAEKVEEVSK